MKPSLKVIRGDLGSQLERHSEITGRGLVASLRRFAKGVNRRLIDITPPASDGITGAAAYRQGRVRIAHQMGAILAPVKLKGRKTITKVFGRTLKKPVTARTRELHPDVAGLYRQRTRSLQNGIGVRVQPGRKFYVDRRKFQSELRRRQDRVGALASGWVAGATALEVQVQHWILRHGTSRGHVKMNLATSKMRIDIANSLPAGLAPHVRLELERRAYAALAHQRAAMKREMEYIVLKSGRESGLKTRALPAVPAGMYGS